MTATEIEAPGPDQAEDVPVLDEKLAHSSVSRAAAAVQLRVYGASYFEIAETLGYSDHHAARRAVEYSLGRSASPETKDELRELLWRRLDRMARAALKKGLDPKHPEQLAALRTALSITDRQLRLRGLDDPAQVTIYTPGHAEIEAFVAQVMAAKMSSLPVEADVIDVEPTEIEEGANDAA